ncbi:hypothetical protein E3Q09_03652 [Wallemia mellicola]|nr:hypothetical protein E3Q09_03652 [Wallemia mellicola]
MEIKNQKIKNLNFIKTIDSPFRQEAINILITRTHNTANYSAYNDAINLYNNLSTEKIPIDDEYITNTESSFKSKLQSLEFELKGYLNNNLKESIRMSYYSLADLYKQAGFLEHSLNCYLKARDYLSSTDQLIENNLNLISLSIELRNYSLIKNSIIKINSISLNSKSNNLLLAAAIADLGQSNFSNVVENICNISDAPIDDTSVSLPDSLVYLSLTALATQSRSQIRQRILDNDALRSKFEFEPHTKQLLLLYCNSNYKELFGLLEEQKWRYILDPHLHNHVSDLFQLIYNRSILQYFDSFKNLSLQNLQNTFGRHDILDQTIQLIKSGSLNVKFDKVTGIFHKTEEDTRQALLSKALNVTKHNNKSTRHILYRIKLIDNNLIKQKQLPVTHTPHKEKQRRNSDQLDIDLEDDKMID